MIRGMYIGRPMVAGALTFTVFVFRALSKFIWHGNNVLIAFFINPYVVFCMFLAAGLIFMYPFFKGIKTLILAPLMVICIAFFVYAYYVLP